MLGGKGLWFAAVGDVVVEIENLEPGGEIFAIGATGVGYEFTRKLTAFIVRAAPESASAATSSYLASSTSAGPSSKARMALTTTTAL